MTAEGLRPGSDTVTPLCLRLTHSGGEVRDGTMRIPAIGAGMADALQLCGERQSDAQWRVANMCRIAWNDRTKAWQLTNNSQTLMCVRNGERVRGGTAVSIAVGDTLELGLLRFVVTSKKGEAAHGRPAKPSTTPGRVPMDGASRIPTLELSAEHDPPSFDLRDLAVSTDDHASSESRTDALDDPFGVLGMASAKSRSTADVLAELLGEIPKSASAPLAPPAPRAFPEQGHSAGLIDELHDEFVRVVQDPGQLAGRTDWDGFLAFGAEPAPTLDELSKQAETYPLLRDILQPREGIDRIIDGFEPLARSAVLDTEQPEDVLSLFAPELARDTKTALPSLTRREHHALSPDSHIHMGGARPSDEDKDGEAAAR
ncbi:TagK domain-containing protein [Variovorax sp. EL159]|uniref:TagK domain-containing protein n=1 Tax=Variovorax sp. EL159 TaxID=1566270 RepID=UPI000889FB89|nr:TagK domain-containing protein [Variovorax sp. EL159]SCX68195.1 hypothetical protein SAMN03159363_3188 [Variovorax sp. EL159]